MSRISVGAMLMGVNTKVATMADAGKKLDIGYVAKNIRLCTGLENRNHK